MDSWPGCAGWFLLSFQFGKQNSTCCLSWPELTACRARTLGLKLMIIFINNCLVFKVSANCEKCSSQFPRAQSDIYKIGYLVRPTVKDSQRLFVYWRSKAWLYYKPVGSDKNKCRKCRKDYFRNTSQDGYWMWWHWYWYCNFLNDASPRCSSIKLIFFFPFSWYFLKGFDFHHSEWTCGLKSKESQCSKWILQRTGHTTHNHKQAWKSCNCIHIQHRAVMARHLQHYLS